VARALFDEAVVVGFDDVPRSDQWIGGVAIAADLCAIFGDTDAAVPLIGALTPYAEHHVVMGCGFGSLGGTAHFLGQLYGVLGDWSMAVGQFERAIEANRQVGAPPLVARSQLEYGRMLLRRSRPDAVRRATPLLIAARATATRIGAAGLLRDIEAVRVPAFDRSVPVRRTLQLVSAAAPSAAAAGAAGR
jgi:hypothetical protein